VFVCLNVCVYVYEEINGCYVVKTGADAVNAAVCMHLCNMP
jgi:hypothetical protein